MSDPAPGPSPTPRTRHLPYGKQTVDEDDINAVVDVLRSDWLTTGPKVGELERAFAAFCSCAQAVAVSNGTAALHAAMHALEIGPGDEVIVPALTFAATSNSVIYQGGTPVFADVDPNTLLIDPASVAARITPRTRAIVGVDYAGQTCDYDALRTLCQAHPHPVRGPLALVADACHALGGHDERNRRVGTLADLSTFSLHPVKPITTGEGGVITTDNPALADRMRIFRNHGITTDHRQREQSGTWYYEMVELGYNYRLSDLQCALGISQLKRLPDWTARRQAVAAIYDEAFLKTAQVPGVLPLTRKPGVGHAYHLYVVQIDPDLFGVERDRVFTLLRQEKIGVNVHYVPVYWHPYYVQRFGDRRGLCPNAESAAQKILSLPIFPRMTDDDAHDVIQAFARIHDQARSGQGG